MAEALDLEPVPVTVTGAATLESPYPVTDFAAASVATAGVALAGLLDALDLGRSTVTVRPRALRGLVRGRRAPGRLGSRRRRGTRSPATTCASDGWIRLHTNAPAHRAAALRVLGVEAVRERVARAVAALAGRRARDRDRRRGRVRGGHAVARRSGRSIRRARRSRGEPLVAREKTDEAGRLVLAGGRATRERRSPGCACSTSRACSPDRSRPGCWPASAPTCCASTRPTGTSPRSCPT